MLRTLDILLGLSMVMLLVSLAVTVLTQFVLSVGNSRGRHLMHGLADLLQQIDPGLERGIARRIAGAVLKHPMVRDVGRRYGAVIHREELATLLMELASGGSVGLKPAIRARLAKALENNGAADSSAVKAGRQVLAKVNAWFDQTMDRVSERFTFTAHGVTFAVALVVAAALQLDTVMLVNRLAADPELRSGLVTQAVELEKRELAQPAATAAGAGLDKRAEDLRRLAGAEILSIPRNWEEWRARWSGADQPLSKTGVLLSAILLSFGAPFWFNMLKNLLRLRSVLASKDDAQRRERQAAQAGGIVLAATGQQGDAAVAG